MIILASSSPRREELMRQAGFKFKIVVSNQNEDNYKNNKLVPIEYVKQIAYYKTKGVFDLYQDSLVIGADTIVVINNQILEKPVNDLDAIRMLKLLSNNTHSVYTAVCIFYKNQVKQFYEETLVTFKPLSDEDIYRYVASGEPIGKAGSYGIQGASIKFVESYFGNLSNVVGLPIEQTKQVIDDLLKK